MVLVLLVPMRHEAAQCGQGSLSTVMTFIIANSTVYS
jgi:hypothetical protein